DVEEDVVGAGLERGQDRAERGAMVRRVAVTGTRDASGRPTRGAIGEPIAVQERRRPRQERRRNLVREPADHLVLAPELLPEPAVLERDARRLPGRLTPKLQLP